MARRPDSGVGAGAWPHIGQTPAAALLVGASGGLVGGQSAGAGAGRWCAVAPTFIDTPLARPFLQDPEFAEFVHGMIAMKRLGTVDEVAAAVLYLASPASGIVTGTSLRVDGGWTAH